MFHINMIFFYLSKIKAQISASNHHNQVSRHLSNFPIAHLRPDFQACWLKAPAAISVGVFSVIQFLGSLGDAKKRTHLIRYKMTSWVRVHNIHCIYFDVCTCVFMNIVMHNLCKQARALWVNQEPMWVYSNGLLSRNVKIRHWKYRFCAMSK